MFWSMVTGVFFWPSLYLGPVDGEEAVALKEDMVALFLARYGRD